MYKVDLEKADKIKKKYKLDFIANEVGLSLTYISLILSNKRNCPKKTAYCIVKAIDKEAEIEDYFIKVK